MFCCGLCPKFNEKPKSLISKVAIIGIAIKYPTFYLNNFSFRVVQRQITEFGNKIQTQYQVT